MAVVWGLGVQIRTCPFWQRYTTAAVACAMSAIFFLNEEGKPLLSRNFRGDVPMSCIEHFPRLIQTEIAPCISHQGVHYVYIRHSNLIICCISRCSSLNAAAIIHFLYKIVDSFAVFVNHVEVESVKDNFVVLYELLDEMMDFGFVQTTDQNLLQDYVTQTSYELEVSQAVATLTDTVSWRPQGIWYKKNELFVDVEETIHATISPENCVLNSEINGVIKLRTYLSGMPHLQLGLNNVASVAGLTHHRASRHVVLKDATFHQCVDLEKWDAFSKIEFIPPDGKADLVSYRVKDRHHNECPMFKIEPCIEIKGRSRCLIRCSIKAQYRRRQQCKAVELMFPVPQECDSPRFKSSMGNVVYVPENQKVVWRIPQLSGGMEADMQAQLLLSNLSDPDASRIEATPILVRFTMPGSAVSGLHIRFLKIDESILKYRALPWVRYHSKSGEYEVRHQVQHQQ